MKLASIRNLAAALTGLLLAGCTEMKISPRQVQSLPTTQCAGEMQVTLETFETGLSRAQTELGADDLAGDVFTCAAFSFKDAGNPSEDWDLAGYNLFSPAGKIRPHDSSKMSWPTNGMNLYLPGWLSPQYPGWKLKMWFYRVDHFPEPELWTIKKLPVPRPDEWLAFPTCAYFHGRKIEFAAICGARVGSTNGYPACGNYPNVHLFAPGKFRVRPVKAIAHFADGRADETTEHFWIVANNCGHKTIHASDPQRYEKAVMPPEWFYGIGIDMPEGVKTIDLTLAVTQVRQVEFVAQPVLITPGETAKPATSRLKN